eukprot:4596882-Amphidinium_carterae.1
MRCALPGAMQWSLNPNFSDPEEGNFYKAQKSYCWQAPPKGMSFRGVAPEAPRTTDMIEFLRTTHEPDQTSK